MKTRHDIEVLKAGWVRDPCWNIETTPGFETHASELHAFRLATEARRKAAEDAREAATDAEADRLPTGWARTVCCASCASLRACSNATMPRCCT